MEYMTIREASEKWQLSVRRIQTLCNEKKIEGAEKFGNMWAIPAETEQPQNNRLKNGKYVNWKRSGCNTIGGDCTTPVLKWAGGKTQMLNEIFPRIPRNYERYIEPFIGGGALYFNLGHSKSIIADSNPELINLYKQLATHCNEVIDALREYKNTEEMYYDVRSKDWLECEPIEAAARMLYLNRTCFNGLYRLNKKGKFNTPFGKYKNPTICNPNKLHAAAKVLKNTTIICGDYLEVLEKYAMEGDLIFLDPPYVPISDFSDFKRYTKEQFYEQDQINLAKEVHRLYEKGCYVLLTNSNHPLVHELYKDFKIDIIQTRRNINSKGTGRIGEDIIVTAYPK